MPSPRVTPSSARAFGGVNVMFGQTVEIETEQNEASSSWPMSKTITVAGKPDISVVIDEEPCIFLAIVENKCVKSTWKCVERHSDSDIGQLLLYQLAVQAQVAKDVAKKRIQTKPTPLLGLFIGGLQIRMSVCDITRRGARDWAVAFYLDVPQSLAEEGMVNVVKALHHFLAMEI